MSQEARALFAGLVWSGQPWYHSFPSHNTGFAWAEIATLALRDHIRYLFCTCLKTSQRHVRSPPSVPESCKEELNLHPGRCMGVCVPIGCFGVEKHLYFLLPLAKEYANRWRMGMGGICVSPQLFWQALPFWQYMGGGLSESPPFWSGEREREREIGWVVSHPLHAIHPSLPSFLPLFFFPFPSLLRRLSFSGFFDKPPIVFPSARYFPLVHSFTRRNNPFQGRNKKKVETNIQ